MSAAKKILVMLAAIMILSTFSAGVYALGVTPAKEKMDFAPGKTEHSMKILNNENKNLKLRIRAGGDLAEYAKLDDDLIVLYIDEFEKELRYKINLPEELEPGTRVLEVSIEQIADDSEGETSLKATAEVIHTLQVVVPYPGKYAEAKLYLPEAKINESVMINIPIMNLGQERIEKASATVKIFENGKEIVTLRSSEISLDSKQEGKLQIPWTADVRNAGVYHAVAVVDYDGKQITLEDDFYIGDMLVTITNIIVEKFNLGLVAKFDIFLESKWNNNIDGIYGEMIISDKQGNELTRYKTSPVDIAALGLGRITSYWDTAGLGVGKYDVKMVLHYAGKVAEKMFEIQVNIDSITTPYTPTAAIISSDGDVKTSSLLVILIIFLVTLNIILILYFRRINGKNKNVY